MKPLVGLRLTSRCAALQATDLQCIYLAHMGTVDGHDRAVMHSVVLLSRRCSENSIER